MVFLYSLVEEEHTHTNIGFKAVFLDEKWGAETPSHFFWVSTDLILFCFCTHIHSVSPETYVKIVLCMNKTMSFPNPKHWGILKFCGLEFGCPIFHLWIQPKGQQVNTTKRPLLLCTLCWVLLTQKTIFQIPVTPLPIQDFS